MRAEEEVGTTGSIVIPVCSGVGRQDLEPCGPVYIQHIQRNINVY